MSQIFTKTGDKGFTTLYDMRRVGKDDMYFEVLGDLDELSANIGVLCVDVQKGSELETCLRWIQARLLDIGSDIATTKDRSKLVIVSGLDTVYLEKMIVQYMASTPPLKEFVLPGVGRSDSYAHVCRAVCRRAERHLWALKNSLAVGDNPLYTDIETFRFVNRLSDFFFAVSRFLSGGTEVLRSKAQFLNVS
jgi:cob(I)alamin adenosyltransferase